MVAGVTTVTVPTSAVVIPVVMVPIPTPTTVLIVVIATTVPPVVSTIIRHRIDNRSYDGAVHRLVHRLIDRLVRRFVNSLVDRRRPVHHWGRVDLRRCVPTLVIPGRIAH